MWRVHTRTSCIVFLVYYAFLFVEVISVRTKAKKYDGYKVLRVLTSPDNLGEIDDLMQRYEVDVWRHPSPPMPSYDVMIPPHINPQFFQHLKNTCVNSTMLIDDVQTLIATERRTDRPKSRFKRRPKRFLYQIYHSLEEINQWMRKFSTKNSDIVSLVPVGTSYQGRKIIALKIGIPSTNTTKRIIWQDSLIHGREWITGATLLWISKELVRNYRLGDAETTSFLQELDWYILPVWNVDGYKFSWNKDRMWRKSRSEWGSFGCYGVDLNRNFLTPSRGVGASSDNPCSEVYHGPFAFSELESSTVRQFMMTKRAHIVSVITLHSYAQYWLYPYGYTRDSSPDNGILERLSKDAVLAMKKTHGTVYKQGTVSGLAYTVSGGSMDWCYRKLCTKYTFGVELRDSGKFGFLLPPSHIIPTAEEYYEGLKVIIRHIIQEPIVMQTSNYCSDFAKHDG